METSVLYKKSNMAEKLEHERKSIILPLARIKTIMKSSPDMTHAGQESIFMVAKATELFVEYLAKEAQKKEAIKTEVSYKSLSKIVEKEDCLQFLCDIVPPKVLAKNYLASLKTSKQKSNEETIEID